MLRELPVCYRMAKGVIGYFRFPDRRTSWGGPFNGQRHRVEMFRDLYSVFAFKTIVETGTFQGTTTDLLASIPGAVVYTVEANPWNYGYCRARFFTHPKITLFYGDSREALECLACNGDLVYPIFFYLDAHWEEDLPLADELNIIFSNWSCAIVMIDDFKVDGDEDYAFDDYGENKALCIDYISPIISKFNPDRYFPSVGAERETGARRGSVVLLSRDLASSQASFSTLRRDVPEF